LKLFGTLEKITGTRIKTIPSPVGSNCYLQTGKALPEESLAIIKQHPATLMTAISSKECPPPSPMGQFRKNLGFYADIRHVVSSPVSQDPPVDIMIFRECSEDFLPDRNMYLGAGEFMPTPDVALSVRVTTREKCAQIARDAFSYAQAKGVKRSRCVHKRTVFRLSCGMFWEEAQKVAERYPGIIFEAEAPDTLAGKIVMNPEDYDVILAASLFGDILSDVAAAKVGNIMRIINTNGENALFYPSHGGLSTYAGTGKVSPMVMFYSAADMLSWLGLTDGAGLLQTALDRTMKVLSLDSVILPPHLKTKDVTAEVMKQCK
jgi:3-isopropylmalate dehydrogenase